jgi:MFS superfamily sulfate permease-like transporter
LTVPALGIAFIAFADTGIVSRAFAARHGTSVDGSQEMAAVGAANIVTGATGGFPVLASPTRTAVAESAGARTQLCGLIGAVLIVAFVLVAPGVTAYLPTSALAAIVIVAASALVDVRTLWWLARVEPVDAALSLAAFVGVVLVGVLPGIAIAIALSLVAFVNRAWRPYRAELGRIPGVRGYHDVSRHGDAVRIPGITIVRFDAPLFFANGGLFEGFVRSVVERAPGTRVVILAAEPITEIDTTAVDQLVRLDDFLATRGIDLVIAEMKGPVKDQLGRYGLADRFGPERFMPTVGAAVDAITGTLRGDLELAEESGPPAAAMS